MTYNGIHPIVKVIKETYHKGVFFPKKAMKELEKRLERTPGLEKWDGSIVPISLE